MASACDILSRYAVWTKAMLSPDLRRLADNDCKLSNLAASRLNRPALALGPGPQQVDQFAVVDGGQPHQHPRVAAVVGGYVKSIRRSLDQEGLALMVAGDGKHFGDRPARPVR